MYRIKVNEKLVGATLIALGLGGLLMGFRWQSEPQHSDRTAISGSRTIEQPLIAKGEPAPSATTEGRQPCKVLNVYDGDTIGCDLNGDGKIQRPQEEIRLLGIDTPERSYSRKNPTYGTDHPTDEPYAKESSEWMEQLVSHKTVYLEYDLRRHDRYNRTLAFVYLSLTGQSSLNLQAVQQGYAKMLFLGKNRLYEDSFVQAEEVARTDKRGLWGLPSASGL